MNNLGLANIYGARNSEFYVGDGKFFIPTAIFIEF